jgi:hypothetical protein
MTRTGERDGILGARSRNRPESPAPPWTQVGGRSVTQPASGARQCRSLARVRSCVQKPVPSQRLPPGGPNNDSCCGTECGRVSTKGRCERLAGAGCGVAPTPSRRSEETPPWPRGPAGRRIGNAADKKGRGGISELSWSGAPRNISLRLRATCHRSQRSCHALPRDAVHAGVAAITCCDASGRRRQCERDRSCRSRKQSLRFRRADRRFRRRRGGRAESRSAGGACIPAAAAPGSAPRRPARRRRRPS